MSTIIPAKCLEDLFNPDDVVEEAWQKILKDRAIAAFTQREFENLPNERVDIQMALGRATAHKHKDRHGQHWNDAWNYRLTFGIVTPRDDDPGRRRHGLMRARVRIAAQIGAGLFATRLLMPYHVLTSITEEGTAPSVVSEDDCDVSEISFTGIVSIHSQAWPTA
jgi:hypothetical protein